jgi:hypothetical protein
MSITEGTAHNSQVANLYLQQEHISYQNKQTNKLRDP